MKKKVLITLFAVALTISGLFTVQNLFANENDLSSVDDEFNCRCQYRGGHCTAAFIRFTGRCATGTECSVGDNNCN